jgi:hypothetical protein
MKIDLDTLATLDSDSLKWKMIRDEVRRREQKLTQFKALNITQNKDQQVTWYLDD